MCQRRDGQLGPGSPLRSGLHWVWPKPCESPPPGRGSVHPLSAVQPAKRHPLGCRQLNLPFSLSALQQKEQSARGCSVLALLPARCLTGGLASHGTTLSCLHPWALVSAPGRGCFNLNRLWLFPQLEPVILTWTEVLMSSTLCHHASLCFLSTRPNAQHPPWAELTTSL